MTEWASSFASLRIRKREIACWIERITPVTHNLGEEMPAARKWFVSVRSSMAPYFPRANGHRTLILLYGWAFLP